VFTLLLPTAPEDESEVNVVSVSRSEGLIA
jgi:hypothetical protein